MNIENPKVVYHDITIGNLSSAEKTITQLESTGISMYAHDREHALGTKLETVERIIRLAIIDVPMLSRMGDPKTMDNIFRTVHSSFEWENCPQETGLQLWLQPPEILLTPGTKLTVVMESLQTMIFQATHWFKGGKELGLQQDHPRRKWDYETLVFVCG